MRPVKTILWYGQSPLAGIRYRLERRGFTIVENPKRDAINNHLLAVTHSAVIDQTGVTAGKAFLSYGLLPEFIDHAIRVLMLGADRATILENHLYKIDKDYPWDDSVLFVSDLKDTNFDNILAAPSEERWRGFPIKQIGKYEELTAEDLRLIARAFPKAEEVHLRKISDGLSGSRVFMAHEKRPQTETSIAHWTQPRLLKAGGRCIMSREVLAMRAVSPFVPFELRPNLEVHVEGFKRAIYIADFVDRSDSMLDAARAGRAEAAISNLFNRTLHRWRDRARQCPMVNGSLVAAAERLGVLEFSSIRKEYFETERIRKLQIDFDALWKDLANYTFEYRAATIHGDLHGENVRVRGDDAILIDLGSIKGDTTPGQGAPLCFDVAILEVALIFAYRGKTDGDDEFQQPQWESEIRPFYQLDAILRSPSIDSAPDPASWMFGCLQRIRAFGIYEQSHEYEYSIALVIALWRWCKFQPVPHSKEADKGRRVVALELGARIIQQMAERDSGKSKASS
jgi:hypothetical protein